MAGRCREPGRLHLLADDRPARPLDQPAGRPFAAGGAGRDQRARPDPPVAPALRQSRDGAFHPAGQSLDQPVGRPDRRHGRPVPGLSRRRPGRDRGPAHPGAAHQPRQYGRALRPAQSRPGPPAARRGAVGLDRRRDALRDHVPRPRRLQAGQRHVRPPEGRRGAEERRAAAGQGSRPVRPCRPDGRRRIRDRDQGRAEPADGRDAGRAADRGDRRAVPPRQGGDQDRRLDRLRVRPGRRPERRRPDPEGRPRALPGQEPGPRHLLLLQLRHAERGRGPPAARAGHAHRHQVQAVPAALPAADRRRRPEPGRLRGADPLAPPDPRHRAAQPFHPARRGNRPDHGAGRMGDRGGVPRRRLLARAYLGRDQHLGQAADLPGAAQFGQRFDPPPPAAAEPARAGGHRIGVHGRFGQCDRRAEAAPGARGQHGARRFRHRLFLARLSEQGGLPQTEDRRQLRARGGTATRRRSRSSSRSSSSPRASG